MGWEPVLRLSMAQMPREQSCWCQALLRWHGNCSVQSRKQLAAEILSTIPADPREDQNDDARGR
jgi:hypothetical protein